MRRPPLPSAVLPAALVLTIAVTTALASALAAGVQTTTQKPGITTNAQTSDVMSTLSQCGQQNLDADTKFLCSCVQQQSAALFTSTGSGARPTGGQNAIVGIMADCRHKLHDGQDNSGGAQ